MSKRCLALLLIYIGAPAIGYAQNITNTSNGDLALVVTFTVTPGTSNAPTSQTASFRIRTVNAAGYNVSALATYSTNLSAPAGGGQTIGAADIGIGVTGVDASPSGVLKPRADTIAAGFDYNPATVNGINGLTPYTGRAAGMATLADIVGSSVTLLSGPQIAATEDKAGATNFITVTITCALLPQYFTPGTFSAVIWLTIANAEPEPMNAILQMGADHD